VFDSDQCEIINFFILKLSAGGTIGQSEEFMSAIHHIRSRIVPTCG